MADRVSASAFERRVRLQVSRAIVLGTLDGVGSRGRCLTPGCDGQVWCERAAYCHACWLVVNRRDRRMDDRG